MITGMKTLLLGLGASLFPLALFAVEITGSNGKAIDFNGVKEARRDGLVLRVKAGAREVSVPWDKFDLAKLETENPEIHAAYLAVRESGAPVALNMGSFAAPQPLGGGTGKWVRPDLAESSEKTKVGEGDVDRDLTPYVFEQKGKSLPFRAFVPKRIKDTDKLPVVLYLHGAGQKGTDNTKQISGHSLGFLTEENQKKYPCIFLTPQCPDDNDWNTRGDDAPGSLAAALVEEVVKAIPQADADRLYVTGYSMGGFGTCSLVGSFPKLFAAAVPMAGAHSGGIERKTVVPFWIFYNTDDDVVKGITEMATKLAEACKDAGLDPKVTVYDKGGHGTPEMGYKEEELLPWIFAQSKGGKKAGETSRFDP